MKMTNNKVPAFVFASFVFFTILFGSCKDKFLEQTNTYSLNIATLSSSQGAVTGVVNGIYDTYQNSDLLKKCIWYRANFSSHDFFNWGGDVFWNNYQVPATFGGLTTLWNQSYLGIARANSAFPIITEAQRKKVISTSLANRLRGEAFFLRGLTYYYLAASFGGVPLEVDTLGKVNLGLRPRSTQDSVFMRVVSDMHQAGLLLWSKTTLPTGDLGRATKGAALAYEGAARMWLKDYAGALVAFNNTEFNNYDLMPRFADANEYDQQNNNESLFEIQFELKSGDPQDWGGSWQPPGGEIAWIDSFSWPAEITQQGYDYGNPALWLSYQAGDTRKLATIVGPGDTINSPGIYKHWKGIQGYIPVQAGYKAWVQSRKDHAADPTKPLDSADARKYVANHNNFTADGTPINTVGDVKYPWYGAGDGGSNGNRTGYFCAKKWRDYNLTGNYGNPAKIFGDQNQILMRYAEVLLSRAECKVRTGDKAGALLDIQKVRDRAWGGVAPSMQDGANFDGSPSQPITDPLQMVLSEYRHELSGEYSVFFNLLRAGTDEAIAFIKNANGTVDGNYLPIPNPAPGPTHDGLQHGLYNTTLTADKALLPIPQAAIATNPHLKQNPSY